MSSENNVKWKTIRDGDSQIKRNDLAVVKTLDHPLKMIKVTERIPCRVLGSLPSTGKTTPVSTPSVILEPLSMALEGMDPLTAFSREEVDPLTKIASEESKDSPDSAAQKKLSNDRPEIDSWSVKKQEILAKFTTSEKISIVTSFLSGGEKVVVKAQSTAVDKVQNRLEQLDYFEEESQTRLNLSQAEYVNRIDQLNRELVSAWNSEQRVKALKIAIQCAKLLSDTTVLRFYPSKFVLITDILDVFGHLVYNRLRNKPDSQKKGFKKCGSLPENFTSDMVSDSTKETCLNWFYKIASIRELVPRLYLEMALLRSYTFLSASDCQDALQRLPRMISGIGNPVVAVFARCYLCRIGLNVQIADKKYLQQNFEGFLDSYHHLFSRSVKADLHGQRLTPQIYMTLFTPALDYILQTVAHDAPENLLSTLLDKCRSQHGSSLILNAIMSAFRPGLIAGRTLQFLEMIEKCGDQGIPMYSLLRTLGLCVSVSPPPSESRRQVLNIVFRYISGMKDAGEYIQCVEPWTVYVVKYFSLREVNSVLGDIISHITTEKGSDFIYVPQLKRIVDNIVFNVQDFDALLAMSNFLPLIDLFHEESVKVEVCKEILTNCISEHPNINDPVIVNSLMFLCSQLHDSVNALTPEDEYRQIGDILCRVIGLVTYGRDVEQQLTFYVEARGMFSNIDVVFVQLVQCVNTLAAGTRTALKGLHTKKSADFVRACAAYCFITVPSIKSAKFRFKLYLLSGQVALFNQCLGQADACFKAVVLTIAELKSDIVPEGEIVSYVKQFLSILLVVPDNPDCNISDLIRYLLLTILQTYQWEINHSLITIYLSVIDLLSIMAQEWYPYHIDNVESNDALYGSDAKFLTEIDKMCEVIVGEILAKLQEAESGKKQSMLAIELLVKIANRSEISNKMSTLMLNLWNLALKDTDKKYMIRTRNYLITKSYSCNNIPLQNLVDKLIMKV